MDVRPTPPDDLLQTRVIFTAQEHALLTPEEQDMLLADFTLAFEVYRQLGWQFDDADVVDFMQVVEEDHVVVGRRVLATPPLIER